MLKQDPTIASHVRAVALFAAAAAALLFTAACGSKAPPPPPPAPPPALSDSEAAALRWIDAHALRLSTTDTMPGATERDNIKTIAAGARVIGLSEISEGTREFPLIVRHVLFSLADSEGGVRGLAIQASMPEALEIDRYVRTGKGDVRRLLGAFDNWRFETPEMVGLVNAIREWNRTHPANRQIGFYGFEIGSGQLAVRTILSLPDSITGAPLKAWLRQQYACVANDEAAHFGLEGRASDSTFWNACGTIVARAADSVAALRARVNPATAAGAAVAFADQMARLVRHYVSTGLRHLPRQEGDAAHVMFDADEAGANSQLLVWGGDVEMGRLTLSRTTIQTGVPLGKELGDRFRPIAFAFGDGQLRTRRTGGQRGGEPGGFGPVAIHPPEPDSYENVLMRAVQPAFVVDMRPVPNDAGGTWLRGPRAMRIITDLYSAEAPQLFDTPIAFPTNYDALIFVRRVTAVR